MKNILILLCVFSLTTGCTSFKPIDQENINLVEVLEVGDKLTIYEAEGRVLNMTLTMIEEGTLHGADTNRPMTPLSVDVKDITKIEIEKIDGGKTALAVVGGTVAVAVVLSAAALGTFFALLGGA